MIIRIVKLSINKKFRNDFIELFNNNKSLILSFEGCENVQLLKDNVDQEIFFTYSHWKNIESLENYRNSSTFKSIWKKTKTYFCDSPEAWSLNKTNT